MRNADTGFANPPDLLLKNGPTVEVQIGLSRERLNRSQRKLPALFDTGAEDCFIDAAIAEEFSLTVISKAEVFGIGGETQVAIHAGVIYVPVLDYFWPDALRSAELLERNGGFAVLLGCRFLCNFKLDYNGITGQSTLTKLLADST